MLALTLRSSWSPDEARPPSSFVSSTALAAAFTVSCTVQEPSVIDPLDPPQADTLVVSPQEASTAVDVPVTFAVPDTTILGNTVSGAVTWTATGGSIDASGVFVADTAGTYEVRAERGGKDGHARSSFRPRPRAPVTLSGIEVTPPALSMAPGGTQQFAAVGRLEQWQCGGRAA